MHVEGVFSFGKPMRDTFFACVLFIEVIASHGFGSLGNYCMHPPKPQLAAVSDPLPEDALGSNGEALELVGAHIIFRHGARDFLSDQHCWNPWKHRGRPEMSYGPRMAISAALHGQVNTSPLVRQYLDMFPSFSSGPAYVTAEQPSWGVGQLLGEATFQFKSLADALRKAYKGRLASSFGPENTHLYATETDRATLSLSLLHNFLFSNRGIANSSAVLHTRPIATDPWNLGGCPKPHSTLQIADKKPASEDPRFERFASRWKVAFGTEFIPGFKDCLIMADCSGDELLEMPAALKDNRSLFNEAISVSAQMYASVWQGNLEACRLLCAPILFELFDFSMRQLKGGHHAKPLALWGCHDTLIATLLVGLGVWDGVWPPYSETVIFEVYRVGSPEAPTRRLFRLLRAGKVLRLPSCTEKLPGGLCDFSNFIPPEIQDSAKPANWFKSCFAEPSTIEQAVPLGLVFPILTISTIKLTFLGICSAFLFFTLGLLCGRQRTRFRGSSYYLLHD